MREAIMPEAPPHKALWRLTAIRPPVAYAAARNDAEGFLAQGPASAGPR
eukprot:CAMPEP_0117598172 /NCGR_PEP_ID=MMETSP0784-20121206/75258_1 /TAXON_ID=39447 /ORGANISM="" /LENGTH=48 /DNA_ID= /DNA_START= /DNA_END= /DNA_ORIENTATION=